MGDTAFIMTPAHHREELGAQELGESNKMQDGPDPREQHYMPSRAAHPAHTGPHVAEGQEEGWGAVLRIELIPEMKGLAP